MEHGRFEIGAEILLNISREFGKSIEWLLTGEDWYSQKEIPLPGDRPRPLGQGEREQAEGRLRAKINYAR